MALGHRGNRVGAGGVRYLPDLLWETTILVAKSDLWMGSGEWVDLVCLEMTHSSVF